MRYNPNQIASVCHQHLLCFGFRGGIPRNDGDSGVLMHSSFIGVSVIARPLKIIVGYIVITIG